MTLKEAVDLNFDEIKAGSCPVEEIDFGNGYKVMVQILNRPSKQIHITADKEGGGVGHETHTVFYKPEK